MSDGVSSKPDQLVLEVSKLFEVGITSSEARALVAIPNEDRDIEWANAVLSEKGIHSQAITKLENIDLNRLQSAIYFQTADDAEIIYLDEIRQDVVVRSLITGLTRTVEDISHEESADTEAVIYRYFPAESESLAPMPGTESHWFFSSIWANRGYLIQAGVASLLTNIFAVGTSLFAMVVYNRIIPSNAMSSLTMLVIGMAILIFADYLVKNARSRFLSYSGIQSDLDIADRLFKKIIDIQYQAKKGAVGRIANVLKEYEQIREFFTSAALVSLIDLPFALIFLWFIWFLGDAMVIPVIVGIVFLVVITSYMQPRLRKIADDSLQDSHDKHSILVEALSGLETLKMLGAGGILRRRFRNILIKQSKIQEESKRYSFVVGNITQEVQQVVQIAVVAVGAVLVSDGEFGFGAIIACTILSGKAVAPFAQLTQLMNRLNQVMSGYRALDELIKAPSEHSDEKHYVPRGRYQGKVTFDAVNFSYPEQEQPTLSDVSFEIKEGQRVGIVGRVGSGKTTIGKLITKLFLPSSGRVALDGVDIRQLDPAEVRENLGTVSQDPWLIAGTIQQNILLGSSSATNQDLLIAAKVAGVSDFTDKHPEGLNMQISERGEGLSGGQKQAIAIARALVRKPPVYLFDEPTSSMDARSERLFIERFKKYSENAQATTIIITHRTSLLSLVDMVMVIDEGKVIKFCPVSEFIKKKPPVKQSQNAQ